MFYLILLWCLLTEKKNFTIPELWIKGIWWMSELKCCWMSQTLVETPLPFPLLYLRSFWLADLSDQQTWEIPNWATVEFPEQGFTMVFSRFMWKKVYEACSDRNIQTYRQWFPLQILHKKHNRALSEAQAYREEEPRLLWHTVFTWVYSLYIPGQDEEGHCANNHHSTYVTLNNFKLNYACYSKVFVL